MTKTKSGYILIYVGKGHHLADCRGYAYLHRVNAEKKIGRKLRNGEEVHHKDGIRDNNEWDNLVVKKNKAYHAVEHRKRSDLKHPDERNYYVECLCGCGDKFLKFDEINRPRDYISGHNPIASVLMDKINNILSGGEVSLSEIVKSTGHKCGIVKTTLSRMVKEGKVVRVERGRYGMIGSERRERMNDCISCACGCGKSFLRFDTGWRERKYISGHNLKKNGRAI